VFVTIVYDNYAYDSRLRVSSGFACLVKTATNTLLFDTGAHGPTLLYNLEQLDFAPEQISGIVISHIDSDHVGGLFKFLERNWEPRVYIPRSFPSPFKDLITLHRAKVVEVARRRQICSDVETTGEMGPWIEEQSLMLRTEKGVILIVGDAHPGIINIIRKVKRLTRDKVYLVVGGFGLSGKSSQELESIVKSFAQLGVEGVAPCHSSGDRARSLFQEQYKENYIESGVGRVIVC
jgi:7,8-dihydropterin-6-yl-methyl-4-(beta-D-ribofuranosyl)aminobenzene 5'-phosphate synthase